MTTADPDLRYDETLDTLGPEDKLTIKVWEDEPEKVEITIVTREWLVSVEQDAAQLAALINHLTLARIELSRKPISATAVSAPAAGS